MANTVVMIELIPGMSFLKQNKGRSHICKLMQTWDIQFNCSFD